VGLFKQSTAVNVTVLMIDSADHVTGKTGLSAGLTIYATKAGGTPGLITPTVTELDSTNVKGLYKLALTTGHTDTLGELQIHVTATGADPTDITHQVIAADLGDSVRLGLTALPNAAAGASGGLPLAADASGRVDVLKINGTSQTARDIGASVLVGDKTGFSLSAGGVQAIWDALSAALTTANSIGKRIVDNLDAAITSRLSSGGYTAPPAAATISAAVVDQALSGHTTAGTVGKALSDAGAAADPAAIAAAVWDEPIADHLDAGSTGESLNAAGSAGDPWTTALPGAYGSGSAGKIVGDNLNAKVGDVKTKTDNLPSDPADESLIISATDAIMSRLGAPAGASVSADVAAAKSDTAAIKTKTDNLPADPADASDIATAFAAVPTANENADALLNRVDGIETDYTVREAMRLMLASLAGKLSGAATLSVTIRDVNDTKNRISATVDTNGNRTAVTLDPS
jgi:hypothetical protein